MYVFIGGHSVEVYLYATTNNGNSLWLYFVDYVVQQPDCNVSLHCHPTTMYKRT